MTDASGAAAVVPYVCMPGSPYTGSTLLGFLLDSHPDISSIGAATGLTRRVDIATYRCSCGARFAECAFWQRVADRTAELGHPVDVMRSNFWSTHVRASQRRSVNGLLVRSLGPAWLTDARDAAIGRLPPIRARLETARRATATLAAAVLEMTGTRVFVDTARDHQRPRYLADVESLDVRAVHLVRDPRGNVASIMKHTGVDVAKAARQWRHYNREAHRVRRVLPERAWLRIRYEDLCADPQSTLDRISTFVGVDPVAAPLDLQDVEHHIIGNSMRLRGIDGIRLDERWRSVLRPTDLDVIARIAGDLSHELGYDWPT